MVEWNSGMVERAINDPVPFFLALEIDVGMVRVAGELSISLQVERVFLSYMKKSLVWVPDPSQEGGYTSHQ